MKIHNYIALTFIALASLTMVNAQGKQDKRYALFKIKKAYKEINAYKNYKKITIDESEDFLGHNTDNGGSLTAYYKDDSVKKIIEWVGLSNKIIQNEYYLNNDKLIFVYSTEEMYRFNERTQNFDYSKLDSVFKGRYYFEKEKLIDTIFNNKQHEETKEQDADTFLTSSKSYLKLLNAQPKTKTKNLTSLQRLQNIR